VDAGHEFAVAEADQLNRVLEERTLALFLCLSEMMQVAVECVGTVIAMLRIVLKRLSDKRGQGDWTTGCMDCVVETAGNTTPVRLPADDSLGS
jgi:hypothetical protein